MTGQRPDIHEPGPSDQESSHGRSRGEKLVEKAKVKAGAQVEDRASRSADHLAPIAEALQGAAQQLDDQGEGWAAKYARRAASQLERATGYMRKEDASGMMADLENTARAHPGTFIGTAFASGVALGRFLRSSRTKDDNHTAGPEATAHHEESERSSPFAEGRT